MRSGFRKFCISFSFVAENLQPKIHFNNRLQKADFLKGCFDLIKQSKSFKMNGGLRKFDFVNKAENCSIKTIYISNSLSYVNMHDKVH